MKTANGLQKFLVGALCACSIGSAQAAVVFSETLADAVINTFVGLEFSTHNFTVSESGIYQATITDLSSKDQFFDVADLLSMKITDIPTTAFSPTVGTPPGTSASVSFTASAAGSFAALVKAISGSSGTDFSAYQVQVTRIGAVPEPGVWALMLGGLGFIGWLRIRKSQYLS